MKTKSRKNFKRLEPGGLFCDAAIKRYFLYGRYMRKILRKRYLFFSYIIPLSFRIE